MELFSTSNMEIITYSREQFNFELPSVILARHTGPSLFLDKLRHCDNCLIKKMLCALNCPVLFWFRLFVVTLRLSNFCLLNLFIYVVYGHRIRWWNKAVWIYHRVIYCNVTAQLRCLWGGADVRAPQSVCARCSVLLWLSRNDTSRRWASVHRWSTAMLYWQPTLCVCVCVCGARCSLHRRVANYSAINCDTGRDWLTDWHFRRLQRRPDITDRSGHECGARDGARGSFLQRDSALQCPGSLAEWLACWTQAQKTEA